MLLKVFTGMQKTFICRAENELDEIAGLLKPAIHKRPVLLFGELGSGKTAFVRRFGLLNGFRDICSPTFTLLNIYSSGSSTILHCDLYRIKTEEQANELNIEQNIEINDYTFIEWPEIIESSLSEYDPVKMHLKHIEGGREIEVNW